MPPFCPPWRHRALQAAAPQAGSTKTQREPKGVESVQRQQNLPPPGHSTFLQGRNEGQDFPHTGLPVFAQSLLEWAKKRLLATGYVAIWSCHPSRRRHVHTDRTTQTTRGAFYSQGTLLDKGTTCPSLPLTHFCLPMSPPGARARAGAAAPLLELPPRSPSSCSEQDPLGIKSPEQGHTEQARTHRHAG